MLQYDTRRHAGRGAHNVRRGRRWPLGAHGSGSQSALMMSVASAVGGLGVSGLADVAAEDGPSESAGAGELGLGDDDANGLPVISVNAAGVGFHELRWKLFFLRTLAR